MNQQVYVGAATPTGTTSSKVCDPSKTYKYKDSMALADLFGTDFINQSFDDAIAGKMIDLSCFAQNVGFFNWEYVHEWSLWVFLILMYSSFAGFAYLFHYLQAILVDGTLTGE